MLYLQRVQSKVISPIFYRFLIFFIINKNYILWETNFKRDHLNVSKNSSNITVSLSR